MSFPEPSSNGGTTSSPVQRLLIAIGTLIVVALTVVAAILLAVRNPPASSVTATPTVREVAVNPSFTPTTIPPTPAPPATDTPTAPPSPTSPPVPTEQPTHTPLPPTVMNTPVPPPPANTPTPYIVIVTPTPLPEMPSSTPPLPNGRSGTCQIPPTWTAYGVQLGDTLDSLSRRTNTSVYDLQQVNCLESFTIQPGQTIYLPFTPPTPTVTSTSTPTTPSPTPTLTGTPTATPRAPEISRADVSVDRTTIVVVGRYFRPDEDGFTVELRGGGGTIPLGLGRLRSSTSFEAVLPAPPDLPGGNYNLFVINPDTQFAQIQVTIPP